MQNVSLKATFWSELMLMVATALLFILPLKYDFTWFDFDAPDMVSAYYISSLVILLGSQLGYMSPLRRFSITAPGPYFIGMAILLAIIAAWLLRGDGRIVDFSRLHSGTLLGPLVFAFVVPFIHAFVSVFAMSREG